MPLSNLLALMTGRLFERRGYTVAANWRLPEIVLGRHLRRLFNRYSVDCVLDVGANKGQYARFLRQYVRYEGLILSFEPISELVEKMEVVAAADPKWKVHRLALGDCVGQADLNVMRHTDLSSFRQPSVSMTKVFSDINQVVRTETVPTNTLVALMPELRREHVFSRPYLKIDTQGYDLAVLRGAGEELAGFVAVQTEMSLCQLYEGAPDWKEVLTFLEERDFSISDLFSLKSRRDLACDRVRLHSR